DGAVRAAAHRALARAQVELAHLHRLAVARAAAALENRLDVSPERDRSRGRGRTRLRAQERADRTDNEHAECERREATRHAAASFSSTGILAGPEERRQRS